MPVLRILFVATAAVIVACGGNDDGEPPVPTIPPITADIVHVEVSGDPGAYRFAVTVSSPDTGCDQYADWWEVVDAESLTLLYRRGLLHSHPGEQPFTRAGGPVSIDPDQEIYVRAHMSTGNYGGTALHGSVADGFEPVDLSAGFAAGLEDLAPLPGDCDF